MKGKKVLIVDDDLIILKNLQRLLATRNYEVDTIANPTLVMELLDQKRYDCILLDVRMPGGIDGLQLFELIKNKFGPLPVIMISGQSTIGVAVEALKKGAYDFIEKPVDPERLLVAVQNAIEKQVLLAEKENLFRELEESYRLIGRSAAMKKIFYEIDKAAEVDAKVLITGESGVGKELVAWAIHHRSKRRAGPYVKVNCAAVPPNLLEAEFFGYKKGAFTGADKDHPGKFLAAHGGTLFMDEIGDMDLQLQAKLLRVLETNEIEMIGETFPKRVDIRVIAATNQDLRQLIKDGRFREELYHRLNLLRIHIPPLRERPEDILPLVYYFLDKFNQSHNKQVRKVHPMAEKMLLNYPWPGNVRELKNVVERMVVFAEGNEITADMVMKYVNSEPVVEHPLFNTEPFFDIIDLKVAHQIFEKNYLRYVLKKVKGNKSEAARRLNIDRTNLYKKLKRHHLED